MGKLTKNQKLALEKIEAGKAYTLKEAAKLVKEITTTKFDASVDIDVRLGVDPRKANQMVRGVVSLPNGTGKEVRVLALCTPDKEAEAKAAGADYVGAEELAQAQQLAAGRYSERLPFTPVCAVVDDGTVQVWYAFAGSQTYVIDSEGLPSVIDRLGPWE